MVVGGKQRLGAQLFPVRAVFQHGAGDTHAVKGGRTPSDLVENQQTVGGGSMENVTDLGHLHHKGGLTGAQIVAGADTGENTVHHAQMGSARRYERAYLRHQHHQRHLAHIGGFARHVGPGDNGHPVLFLAHIGVVGDKQTVPPHLLHHGVTAVMDLQHTALVHHRMAVVVLHRHGGKGAERIDLRHGGSRALNTRHL